MSSNIAHELVPLDRLTIDPLVQRKEGVAQPRVQKMVAQFNPDALGAITVSKRPDGTLVLLDGAHRTAACRAAGHTEPLHALVYTGLTLQQEAAAFALLNDFKQPSFISRMLAKAVSGDDDAMAVIDIITKRGWTIGFSSENGTYAALAAAERVYRNAAGARSGGPHPEVLEQTIQTITDAWARDRESAHQMITLGIGQVIGRFQDAIDFESLSNRLSQERPNHLVGKARALRSLWGGGTVHAAFAHNVVGIYNNRRRTRQLPEWTWRR